MMPITKDSPEVIDFLVRWHEAGRNDWDSKGYKNLKYDEQYAKRAVNGKRWLKLNAGPNGVYVCDVNTLAVYEIKGYGVPNLKKPRGQLNLMFRNGEQISCYGR